MDYVTLGFTGITVNKNGFGALPLQRLSRTEGVYLLKKAFDNGITFFDSARYYTDSEEKIGLALSSVRDKIILATKSMAKNADTLREELEVSLNMLKTDYIDIYQFHMANFCPRPRDDSGLYDAMLKAKSQGKIRHIGISSHKIHVACEAARSGLYETVQYPISYLASREELDLVPLCKENNVGVIAMKSLAGGVITNSAAAYAFLRQFDNLLPIWGVQREKELDEFISYQDSPPALDDDMISAAIERDIAELSGNFCRGCGYCMPCPAGIEMSVAARMSLLLKRMSPAVWLTEYWRESMSRVENCIDCGHCETHCPYELDPKKLARQGWEDYRKLL